ncbi:MAG: hypothetical protein SFV24_12935 [Gemmatimonadales bacterium]|nr:hypothetical protein [Gemmatimonadales bacterium]
MNGLLQVEVNAAAVFQLLDRFGNQALEAAALGINRTVEEGLSAARDQMRAAFIMREPRMLPPHQLPRAWRATPRTLEAPMQLGDDEGLGRRRRQVFSKFEEGGPQTAKDPANWPFAVPTEHVRASPEAKIPKRMLPRNLVGRFNQDGGFTGLGRKANTQTRFKKLTGGDTAVYRRQVGRYFVLGGPGDRFFGIYERTGPGDGDIRKLWSLVTDRRIPALLEWRATAFRIGESRLGLNVQGALDVVLK